MKNKFAKSLGAALLLGCIPVAWAQSAADKRAPKVSDYAWPKETSSEPKDDEWANATQLETLKLGSQHQWESFGVTCSPRVVREWVKLTCAAKEEGEFIPLFGVIWGMAGDLSTAKGSFTPASTLERYKDPPKNENDQLTRKMGAAATAVFQAKPGSAMVLQFDELFWNLNYEGLSVETRTGMMVDVSWAMGENAPTIVMR
jgi:hypothetical protein